MAYAITYSGNSVLEEKITTESAEDAVKIARRLAADGHALTIEKEGQALTLEELERDAS